MPTCGLTALLSASAIHQWYLPTIDTTLIACVIVAGFTLVNLAGVRWVARLALPIAAVSALLAFLAALVPVISGSVDWHRAASFHLATPFSGWFGGMTSVMAGLYLVGFAAPAFEAVYCHVGEMKDPVRDLPRAVKASAGMAGVYFLLLPVIWLGVFGSSPLQGDLAITLGPAFAPLLGSAAKSAALAFMVFNMFHGSLQPLAGASRTLAQLSEDGLLPTSLSRRSRTDAPWVATLVTAAFATIFLLAGDPLWVVAGANFTYLIGIALPSIAVWLLRHNDPDLQRTWRAPPGTIMMGVGAAVAWAVATVLGFQQFGLPTVLFGIGLAYSGVVLYVWRVWRDRRAAGLPIRLGSLHVKLAGAMMAVLALDSAGYLLAVSSLSSEGRVILVTICEDIFVAVAMLTIGAGLVLPGLVGNAIVQIAAGADRLARGSLAELTGGMEALGHGRFVGRRTDYAIQPVVVHTHDELHDMAVSFNTMQSEVARAALALDAAGADQMDAQFARDHASRLQAARFAVTRSLASAGSVEEVVPQVLEGLSRGLEWCMAEYWEVRDNRITWHSTWDDPDASLKCYPRSGRRSFAIGEDIPGQTWAAAEAIFIPDIRGAGLERSDAAREDGLKAAIGFPVVSQDTVCGVVVILSRRDRELDPALLEIVNDVGSQVGQFLERQGAEERLRRSEIRSRAVLDNVTDGVISLSSDDTVESLNPAAAQLLGVDAAVAVGQPAAALLGAEAYAAVVALQAERGDAAPGDLIEATTQRVDGTRLAIELGATKVELGAHNMWLVSLRDITERRAQTEALEHQALHDALTGLPNRTLFIDRLGQSVTGAERRRQQLGVLFMDLNGFKDINDTLGHHIGDAFLVAIAGRLKTTLRDVDTIARLGGDEFAILPDGGGDIAAMTHIAKLVAAKLEAPFEVEGTTLDASASIGIAMYPQHGDHAAILMRHADVAMYSAKQRGGGFAIYAEGDDEQSAARLSLSGELRNAIAMGHLTLHYQPKVDMRTARVSGVEALVRWQHSERGLIAPDVFIPIAEQSELIKPLTAWVLGAAIADLSRWRTAGIDLTMAVNLSARNLHDADIVQIVRRLLRRHRVPAERLTIELTESTIMTGTGSRTLQGLKALGTSISIDDFGTGYSSLAYLKRLPVTEIKIDRSFVTTLSTDADDAAIVRPTISLGHNLGLQVVAEGVEDGDSYAMLADYGCDFVQGYFISRPLSAEDLESWLRTSEWGDRETPRPPRPKAIRVVG